MSKTPKPPRRGRPPKAAEAMLNPITIRITPAMDAEIEAMMAERKDGADKSTVLREVIAKGLGWVK